MTGFRINSPWVFLQTSQILSVLSIYQIFQISQILAFFPSFQISPSALYLFYSQLLAYLNGSQLLAMELPIFSTSQF